MKVVRILLRIISYLLLLTIIGFIIWFALVNLNVIDNPYEEKVKIINLSQSEIRLKKKNSSQLKATIYPEGARNGIVEYTSDKEDIVTVNKVTGYVMAKDNGVATITATLKSNNKVQATCLVIVSDSDVEITDIKLNATNINLKIDSTFTLTYKLTPASATLHEIEFTSSDPSVATVDETGVIKGISEGKAIIEVSDKISGIKTGAEVEVSSEAGVDPKSIEVEPTDITIGVGGSQKINVLIKPSDANANVTWQSLDDDVASVSSSGVITGKKTGSTQVVVTTVNNKSAYVDVKVTNESIEVEGIKAKTKSLTMDIGNSKTIEYTITPSNATNQGVTITSSDSDIVKVNGHKITAVKEGNATITIKTNDGGHTDTIDVKVKKVSVVNETDIQLSTTKVSLKVGGSQTVTATVLPKNATYKTVTWKSIDTSVATVKDGLIVGKAKGKTEVVVTTTNRKITKKIMVTVSEVPVESVSLDKSQASIHVGETVSLVKTITPSNATNKDVTWTSSDISVATVSDSGVVTAKKAGKTTITVTTNNNMTAKCIVTVLENDVPITAITLNKTSIYTTVDDKIIIEATIEPANATNKKITWETSDPNVATVSDGVVLTKGVGTATITATTNNGKKATCKVTVEKEMEPESTTPLASSNTFTIIYKGNGSTSGSVSKHTCTKNKKCTIKSNSFKKTGYTFVGWTTKSNGKDDGYNWTGFSGTWKFTNGQRGIANNKLTLYAMWKKDSYVITKDKKYSKYGNIASCNTDTLKYRIIKYSGQYIILVWAKDPSTQLNNALAKTNANGVAKAETILKNEIKANGYSKKCMIAVNASFFDMNTGQINGGVAIHKGKIAKDKGVSATALIGINKKGNLTKYAKKTAKEILNDGVRNTFVASSLARIDNTTLKTNRTQICQYDKNNFVILSGTGTVKGPARQIEEFTGCKDTYNLDGGGSRKLYYKTQSTVVTKLFGGGRELPDMLYFVE